MTGWYDTDSTETVGEDTTLYLFDIASKIEYIATIIHGHFLSNVEKMKILYSDKITIGCLVLVFD